MNKCAICGCGLEHRMIMRYMPGKELPDSDAICIHICKSCGYHAYTDIQIVDATDKIRITPDTTTNYLEYDSGERRILVSRNGEFIDDRPSGFNLPIPTSWVESKEGTAPEDK